MRRRGLEGAVTVFLTFVLFLVLSLVLVSLESARQQATATMVRMNLAQALESTLGHYYAPLYDEYGIYGLYEDTPENLARGYADASANPTENLPVGYMGNEESGYSYAYEITELALTSATRLTDGGGTLCKRQMTEVGVYCGVEALAQELLAAVNLLESTEATLGILEEKMAVEEKLSEIDELLLKLMPVLDGVSTEEDGVIFDKGGKIVITNTYVKQLVPGAITQDAVLINNMEFYRQLQPHYVNGNKYIEDILYLANSMNAENATEITGRMLELQAQLQAVTLGALINLQPAIEYVTKIQTIQQKVRPLVESYEKLLLGVDDLLENDVKNMLSDSLADMKNYVGMESDAAGYDFGGMLLTLQNNQIILQEMQELFVIPLANVGAREWCEAYRDMQVLFEDYSLENLYIDYEYVRKATTAEESLWALIRGFILDELSEGLFPESVIFSSRDVWNESLPSDMMSGAERDLFLTANLEDTEMSWDLIRQFFGEDGLQKLLDYLADGVEAMAEKLLLIVYMEEHFSCYTDNANKGALRYEQEYLIFGHKFDKSNVEAAALGILGLRVAMNVVHTFTDPAKNAQATECATTLLGAVGMPFLISLCKYIVLFVWGVQNAQVETAAILQGKEVPFLVSTKSCQVAFGEVFTMGKDTRLEKAKNYSERGTGALDYEHYLLLFMLLCNEDTLTARAMDVIQCNLRLYYDPEFELRKCYFGFGVLLRAEVPALYTTVSFGGYAPQRNVKYEISMEDAVSY